MDPCTSEQALRREAIRRRLAGERRGDTCRDLDRSLRWVDKWWAQDRRAPHTDFADQSRVPHTWPQQIPPAVRRPVVAVRKTLEAAQTPQTRSGLIGPRAIQGRLHELPVHPLPSLSTIQRIRPAQGLTHPVGAGQAAASSPWPVAGDVKVIQATDLMTRHVHGGEGIENFPTIAHYSPAVWMTQPVDQRSVTARAHLLQSWASLGLPRVHQFDNEGAFCGGYPPPGILGQVVRLCLFCGVEPWVIPVDEAERHSVIEGFHSLWEQGFWSRQRFRNLEHVQEEAPLLGPWYHYHYRPPRLQGKTPAPMRRGAPLVRLTSSLRRLIPQGRLPITAGRGHLGRRVTQAGYVELLNQPWWLGPRWRGEEVRAPSNTRAPQITVWHQPDADRAWHLIKTRKFPIAETVHDGFPEFRRNRARCRDSWPD